MQTLFNDMYNGINGRDTILPVKFLTPSVLILLLL